MVFETKNNLKYVKMEENLIFEDDLNSFKIEEDLNSFKIEDNLNSLKNGIRSRCQIRQPITIKIKTMVVAPLRVT